MFTWTGSAQREKSLGNTLGRGLSPTYSPTICVGSRIFQHWLVAAVPIPQHYPQSALISDLFPNNYRYISLPNLFPNGSSDFCDAIPQLLPNLLPNLSPNLYYPTYFQTTLDPIPQPFSQPISVLISQPPFFQNYLEQVEPQPYL
jgi:hypothetical protein